MKELYSYTAGLIDGEGTITLSKNNSNDITCSKSPEAKKKSSGGEFI